MGNKQKTVLTNMVDINSIINNPFDNLKAPIKRQNLADWIKKQDSTICCL